jgi:hypothetical protein
MHAHTRCMSATCIRSNTSTSEDTLTHRGQPLRHVAHEHLGGHAHLRPRPRPSPRRAEAGAPARHPPPASPRAPSHPRGRPSQARSSPPTYLVQTPPAHQAPRCPPPLPMARAAGDSSSRSSTATPPRTTRMRHRGHPAAPPGRGEIHCLPPTMAPELFRESRPRPRATSSRSGSSSMSCAPAPCRAQAARVPALPRARGPRRTARHPPLTERVPGIDLDFASLIQRPTCRRCAPRAIPTAASPPSRPSTRPLLRPRRPARRRW